MIGNICGINSSKESFWAVEKAKPHQQSVNPSVKTSILKKVDYIEKTNDPVWYRIEFWTFCVQSFFSVILNHDFHFQSNFLISIPAHFRQQRRTSCSFDNSEYERMKKKSIQIINILLSLIFKLWWSLSSQFLFCIDCVPIRYPIR